MMIMDHRHILVTARGLAAPPRQPAEVDAWLRRLVDAVGMTILMGPFSTRCETAGNEGVTGAVVIETSHATLHCWDALPESYLQLDLYSCATFGSGQIITLLREFAPREIEWIMVDRNLSPEVIETGHSDPRPRAP